MTAKCWRMCYLAIAGEDFIKFGLHVALHSVVCHDQVGKSVVSVHSESPDWYYFYLQTTLLQLLKKKRKQRNLILKVKNLILRLNDKSLHFIEFEHNRTPHAHERLVLQVYLGSNTLQFSAKRS